MNTLGCQLSEEARLSGQEWRGTEAESIPPQQSSRVIHGRKASTFLGIFDSAPPLDSKGKKQSQVQLQLYSGATEDKSGVSEDQSKKKRKKKKREKELTQLVEDEDNTDGKAIMTSLGSRQQDLELYGGGVSDVSVSQESVLKPISSATYFPHKLKEGQDNDSVGQVEPQHKHDNINIARRHSSSEVSIASRGESSVLSCSTETAIVDSEDEDNVFSSDETQEFPLKVELQPFTDNVGGHTAIFRFSERAVCKTLVNRENNWYETIELKHPDLLQFMPRYIGVLNVRQHFNSKEDFLNSLSPKKAKVVHEEYRDNIQAAIDGLPSSELQPLLNASSPINMDETPLPEVCLDDNKHIIPDSLWCRYSHSPSSLPSEHSWPGTSDRSNNEISNLCGANPSSAAPIHPTGSTLVNTRLKDLIIEEVFGQPSVPSRSQQIISHHHQSHGRNHSRHVVQHTRHHSNPNDRSEKMRIQYSDSIAAFPNTKQSRSSSTSSTTNRFASRKVRHDSRNSLVDLREMKQDICSKGDDELFGLDDDSSVVVSVPSSPKSQPQATAHESISYEEVSHTVVSKFILLEDLTRKLKNPCVLDLKMGTRQYGVDAKRSKQLSQREKCRNTTSRRLGVRICGLKIWNRNYYIIRDKYFGRRVKIGWQFVRVLARFLYDGISKKSILRQIPSLIRQLDTLYSEVVKLKSYRMYGASLLLMYDGSNPSDKRGQVKLNLIDFARCVTKKDMETSISTFRVPPKNPESEDRGFLRGLRSLRFYLLVIWNYLTGGHPLVYDEGELMEYLNSEEEFQNGWDWIGEFEKENESGFNDSSDELRKKWRKYELIFGVEPRCGDEDVSD